MTSISSKEKSHTFLNIIHDLWTKRSDKKRIQVNNQRERYVGILQKRYGYTKEKAISELNTNYAKTSFD